MELNQDQVRSILPNRLQDGHKGQYGKLLLLCGSLGYTGAAALAAMGALRGGAGLVYLGVPNCIYAIEAVKLTEAVVFPLPDKDGALSRKAIPEIRQYLEKVDAVLIGCGLGQSKGTRDILRMVLREYCGPVVLDADAITMVAQQTDWLTRRQFPTILTPHEGEFQRFGIKEEENRIHGAQLAARNLNCIMVRKGYHTVITDGKSTYQNPTGNPGMAVGGSGDVLAGLLVGLLGQGIPPLDAAACAAWIHGAAGDICAQKVGQYGMLPSDILNELPRFLK